MAVDYYKELGVSRTASAEEIKRAYRKLASELHPDKHPDDAAAEARFKRVNRANQVLSDSKQRALYDEFGEQGLREGFNPAAARAYGRGGGVGGAGSTINLEDLFSSAGGGFGGVMSDLFGGRGGRRRAKAKGADIASEVTVDFGAAISGTEVQVRLQDHAEPVKVRIPAGAGDGDKVRVPGHGAPGVLGGGPGDLIIAIRVRPHEHFERNGLDLYLDLPIGVAEAYRGGKVTVPTPAGNVTMKVPKLAQSGQVVRLKGRGVKRKNAQGDLYVRFLIRLPSAESADLDEAVEAFEQAADENLRAGISF